MDIKIHHLPLSYEGGHFDFNELGRYNLNTKIEG